MIDQRELIMSGVVIPRGVFWITPPNRLWPISRPQGYHPPKLIIVDFCHMEYFYQLKECFLEGFFKPRFPRRLIMDFWGDHFRNRLLFWGDHRVDLTGPLRGPGNITGPTIINYYDPRDGHPIVNGDKKQTYNGCLSFDEKTRSNLQEN